MLDANLYSLKLVKSAIEPDKTFLINESDGEPVYFRLRSTQEDDSRIELYHSLTMAPLGSYQHISSKLKLIALRNPNSTIELRNTGYLTWEWTFEFERGIKFSWRKNIIGLSSQKRGFSCFLVRKPDPDYPCAIYRPGSSTTPASVQFLDFNIRRIENLTDGRGLEQAILLSLLGFTEAMADYESRKASPSSSPPTSNSAIEPSYRPPQLTRPVTIDYEKPEANEILVSESSTVSEACNRGLNLFKDPLFLYLFVHAPSPNSFKNAVKIANEIKQTHFKRTKEELYQYLIDDIMIKGNSKADLKNSKPNSLKIYLSRTSLDELLPTQGIQSSRRDSHSTQKTSEQKMNRTNEPARTKTRPPELPPKSEEDTQKWKIWSGISRRG
ncbi:hypothetical protein PPACK8108_LOCUS13312 [Phakopsora pachyrhizi]|uniref:Uncharacterized protein n=1 Tax=Phakopsora pachyrhizi TaxID=170000 RepID=A0AAV0B5E3_PHAPC|nr:hypothetical protein PPACK8108_LOCUS13312 [Phakopsora pachyrhizi]